MADSVPVGVRFPERDALLEVIEQLHGWICEFDPNPCPIAMYLGGTADEVTRWVDALGPLAFAEPEGYVADV